jgi:hypothetical protein
MAVVLQALDFSHLATCEAFHLHKTQVNIHKTSDDITTKNRSWRTPNISKRWFQDWQNFWTATGML